MECPLFEFFFPSSSSLILIAFGLDKHSFHVTRVTLITRVSNQSTQSVRWINAVVLLPDGPYVGPCDLQVLGSWLFE